MTNLPRQRGRPKNEELTARRHGEILDAAAKLFAARGYRNTDVQWVADEIGVGKGTIYRYFPTKRDLFLAAVDRGMQRLREAVQSVSPDVDPLEQMMQAIRAYLTFFDSHPEFVELIIQERAEFKDRAKPTYFQHREGPHDRWQNLLRSLIAAGRVRDVPVRRIVEVVGDLLYGTMFTNYLAGRQKSLEEQAREILDFVLCGILTPEENARRCAVARAARDAESARI